ncbi:putative MFS transporter [Bisporella sp. PMI_857]|nr:putative MFS transporter [Bisporella sp. PMI_857]
MEMNYDESTLHELEEELHTRIYPGTEIMTDVGSHHFVKSSDNSHRVLVPQPSPDPNDPLNWNPMWKLAAMSTTTLTSFAQGFGPLALAPMFPQLIEAFDSDLAGVVRFTSVCILVLGFSNFIWVPIQTSFGRRPVLIFSTLICLVSNIWRAVAKDYSSFMGACILNGIGAGPAETAQPTITADVMFLHERGFWNTLYFAFYFGSLMVGPIIAGPMAVHAGWRNFWWLNVALLGLTLVLLLFFFPETKWHRQHPKELAAAHTATFTPTEKGMTSNLEDPKLPHDQQPGITVVDGIVSELDHTATAEQDPYLHRGSPSKKQFKLWQNNRNALKSILLDLWIPWKLFAFPIVEFAAFVVSWSASSFLTLNLTQSQNFAAPPYNFSAQSIGFMNFAILIGAMLGLLTNGPLSDWVAARATRKNKGIREPEMRLPAMIPYVLIMLLGNFVVAFGYEYKWDWKAIVIVGYTCAGIQVAAIPSIASTYAVDSYKPVAGSIFVAITVNKNLWGYGFAEFVTPWIIADGYLPPIMLNMSLIFLWCSFGVLFYFVGKTCRKWTRNSKVHDM